MLDSKGCKIINYRDLLKTKVLTYESS